MMCQDHLAILRAAAPELRQRFGVDRIGLFGSVARDAATSESDADVVVSFAAGEAPGLGVFALEKRLEELLGRPTRIAALARMNPVVRAAVERDLVYA